MNKRFLQSVVHGQVAASAPAMPAQSEAAIVDDPQVVPLPEELVYLLDQAAGGGSDAAAFRTWLARMEAEIGTRSLYLLHDAEEKCLNEAGTRLGELARQLSAGALDEAVETALHLFRWLNRFEMQRERNRQSTLPAVNELLIAGLSCQQGRAEPGLVTRAIDYAVEDIDQMVELYKQGEEVLPESVRQAFLTGIDRAGEGVAMLRAWDGEDRNALREALQKVATGSGLLATLQEWKAEHEQAVSGSVPLVGEYVQLMLAQLAEQGAVKEKSLLLWHQERFPALLELWERIRPSLLVKSPFRQQIIHEMDGAMQTLATLSELPPPAQQRTLSALDDLFARMESHRLDLSGLPRNPARWRADFLLAVSAGGIPDFYLRRTIEEMRAEGDEQTASALEDFLLRKDGAALVARLEEQLS